MAGKAKKSKRSGITWEGTGVTGVKKSGVVFQHSGVDMAELHDKYLNTDTGHVYECTSLGTDKKEGGKVVEAAGSPTRAKWSYVKTLLIKKPSGTVSGLSVKRGEGRRVEGSWKVPANLVSATNGGRATELQVEWTLDIAGVSAKNDPDRASKVANENATSTAIDLANVSMDGKAYARSSFYPFSGKKKLNGVSLRVRAKNANGYGPWSSPSTLKFNAPAKPSISDPLFSSTGDVSFTVTAADDSGAKERYDTHYRLTRRYKTAGGKEDVKVIDEGDFTGSSKELTSDAASYQALTAGGYYVFEAEAYSRGYAGDSGPAGMRLVIAKPAVVPITKLYVNDASLAVAEVSVDMNAVWRDKKVKAGERLVKTTWATCLIADSQSALGYRTVTYPVYEHEAVYEVRHDYRLNPVSGVQLQALANVAYASASDIPANAAWSDVGTADDANCTALSVATSGIVPDAGKYTWLRVKSWWLDPSIAALCSYSEPQRAKQIETPAPPTPTGADDECTILGVADNGDGSSVTVTIGFDKKDNSSRDDCTGTQLTWSRDEGAWKSVRGPEEHEFTWADDTSADGDYHQTATIRVDGLDEGEVYYFRARRYLDGDTRTNGPWSNTETCMCATEPSAVALSAPATAAPGAGVPISWAHDTAAPQKAWMVKVGARTIEGDGQMRSMTIEAPVVAGALTNVTERVASDGSTVRCGTLALSVGVSTGGAFTFSREVAVEVVEPPDIAVSLATLTAQPLQVGLSATVPGDEVQVAVTARGCHATGPAGRRLQAPGDVVWSGVFAAEWAAQYETTEDESIAAGKAYYTRTGAGTAASPYVYAAVDSPDVADIGSYYEVSGYAATATLPDGLDFVDGASYDVEAVSKRLPSGVSSPAATASFAVAWSHQAPSPPTGTMALTSDESPVEGKDYHTRSGTGTDADPYVFSPVEEPDAEEIGAYYEWADGVAITPYDVSAGNRRSIGCTVSLPSPDGYAAGDVYDVYRVTPDSVDIVGEGLQPGSTVDDPYAPFGDGMAHRYRVACRTADGDVSWLDFDYTLPGGPIRFDWAGDSQAEVPYNIGISYSYEKDFDGRPHLEGSTEGYWNDGVARTGQLSGMLLRVEDAEALEAVCDMAQHPGPVFCRTPDGRAFQANVNTSQDVSGKVAGNTFSVTRVALTDEFRTQPPGTFTEAGE